MAFQSHYDELCVKPTATSDEIRAAYRQAALEHHPDKNRDDPEAGTRFQRIQQAYAVLSNDHERAWYDSQRQKNARTSDVVDIASLMNDDAYEDFGEGKSGFWRVYGLAFDSLGHDEYPEDEAMPDELAPRFGNEKSRWEEVKRFYGWWEGFSTSRGFEEADKWNLADARSRYERRAMEKENNKERVKRKKDYSTQVKEFVLWIKRRDPRIKEQKLREQEAREKESQKRAHEKTMKKLEREEAARVASKASEDAMDEDAEGLDEVLRALELDEEIARREKEQASSRSADANGFVQDSDTEGEKEYVGPDAEDVETEAESSELEQEILDDFYCVACKKLFRSIAQLRNHEKSKKHRQFVARLRENFVAEDEITNVQRENEHFRISNDDTARQTPEASARRSRRKKLKKRERKQNSVTLSAVAEHENNPTFQEGTDNIEQDLAEEESETRDGVPDSRPSGGNEMHSEIKPQKTKKKRRRKDRGKGEKVIKCNVCSAVFPSKTKLFAHVREFGHAMRVDGI